MIKAVAYGCADVAATLLAALIRPVRPILLMPSRFIRLARLRAGITGRAPVTTQLEGKVTTTPGTRVTMGRYCRLGRDLHLETQLQGSVELGSHVRVNTGCVIVSYAHVRIGDDCLIGEYVSIRDANHGTALGQPMRSQAHTSKPIVIDDDVWIGRGSVVLGGVHIGAGAVVAANSVVTGDVPPMAVVAGAPARVIRQRNESPTAAPIAVHDEREAVLADPAVADSCRPAPSGRASTRTAKAP